MRKLICNTCEKKVDRISSEGLCVPCENKLQDENNINLIQYELPEGLIAFWNDTPSYLNREKNRRYFKIPDTCDDSILDDIKYKIIVVKT